MIALGRHQIDKAAQDVDPLVGLQPAAAVGENLACGLDLALQRCGVVDRQLCEGRAVERLDHLDHDLTPFSAAWAFSSSTSTRTFSE